MAVATWKFILTDEFFEPIGEIQNASERKLSIALNRIDTASFNVRIDNPLAERVSNCDGWIKIYCNDTLMFFGMIITAEKTYEQEPGMISANCAAPGWLLQFRYPNLTNAVVMTSSLDRAVIVKNLINDLYDQFAVDVIPDGPTRTAILATYPDPAAISMWNSIGGTTIDVDTLSMTSGSSIIYGVPPFKSMLDIINELSASVNGFEWKMVPVDNWSGDLTDVHAVQMTCAPTLGTDKPEVFFELGDGKLNVKTFRQVVDRQQQANVALHQPASGQTAAPVYAFDDVATNHWMAMMVIIQSDLTDLALQQALVDRHVQVRAEPRRTFSFDPAADYGDGRVPQFRVDYDIGDTINARAVLESGTQFEGQMRVWGVEFTVDANGVAAGSLTLSAQGS